MSSGTVSNLNERVLASIETLRERSFEDDYPCVFARSRLKGDGAKDS